MALSKIDVANMLTGTAPVANGGTGVTTASALANTGNMVLIKSVTADNDSAVIFDHGSNGVVLDTTYSYYKIIGKNMQPATDIQHLRMYFRSSGSNITSGYDTTRGGGFVSTSWVSSGTNGTGTFGYMSYNSGGNATGELESFEGNFSNHGNAGGYSLFWGHLAHCNNSGDLENTIFANRTTNSTTIDGLQFYYASGDVKTATISLYGVKE